MIRKFGEETGLLLIDVQKGVDVLQYWGGSKGRRNNLTAEEKIKQLLMAWRKKRLPVFYTMHDSREAESPLKLNTPTGEIKPGLEPIDGEIVVIKDVNSGFIGTNLELMLRRKNISRLVVVGFFTNMCVATTVRMAGNLGFDTYLVGDACACTNRQGLDGRDFDANLIHDTTMATLHGEFCTALKPDDVLGLLESDNLSLERVQGNE